MASASSSQWDFPTLPSELMTATFTYLDGISLARLEQTCRRFLRISTDNGLWEVMCRNEHPWFEPLYLPVTGWKVEWRTTCDLLKRFHDAAEHFQVLTCTAKEWNRSCATRDAPRVGVLQEASGVFDDD
eukprot:TRINITY_DN20638_c0_g1_i1.p1 TRINITY_DN20638_c0_g1~~TRINITY_DN20638_c0_g1_i1.p1  ORF type:complete len:129 (+),score=0.96 TRINITY_DN20638_c0_g1_i1:57-443(+)